MPVCFIANEGALARLKHASVDGRLTPLLLAREVATCGVVDLELLYSARSAADMSRRNESCLADRCREPREAPLTGLQFACESSMRSRASRRPACSGNHFVARKCSHDSQNDSAPD